ncbi:hypothetical protein EK21DRAFT_55491 [Setomelanomma holmii]|uniref:DUF7905 domain-containing protein n=1 Tax=Setomelanomma holmii TaxID=210430 RepID=A0A9P4LR32_9PLEO|nr:hypothetical protein EK21DRAFT_55491 [Setomelanomma holmii]
MQQRSTSKHPSIWDPPPPAPVVDRSALIGKKPNKVIPVPREYQRQTLGRERDILINDVKIKTNCDIVLRWDLTKITSFELFGSGPAVDKATRYVNEWISNAQKKSIGASAWAKISAWEYLKWYYDTVEELEVDRKQKYTGPIGPNELGELPKQEVIVQWPEDLVNQSITPRDAFGNKLEALNALRMHLEVYISLLPSHGGVWQIEIVGYHKYNVQDAEERLNTMIDRVRADASGVQHAHNVILDEREGIDVELQQDESWWPNHVDNVVPRLLPSGLMDEPGTYRQEGLDATKLSGLRYSLKLALDNVRTRKGAYDFAVRLGCVALSSKHVQGDKIGQTFNRKDFLNNINTKVEIDIKKWLAIDDFGYRILLRLMASTDFLNPIKSAEYFGYTPKFLKDTRPIFRGSWVFRDPDSRIVEAQAPVRHAGRPTPLNQTYVTNEKVPSPPSSMFVIQVDWTEDEEGHYEKGTPRFYKLGAGKTGPTKNIDVNLLELGESRGWQFALESLIPVAAKIVPPILSGFAERIKMKKNYKPSSTESFADWDQTPTIKKHLCTGRLDSIYSFGILDTCYKIELTAMWYPQQKRPVWGLTVRHTEWATHLAELEALPVGRQASWEEAISTFFPEDGQMAGYKAVDDEYLGMDSLSLSDKARPKDGMRVLTDTLLRLSDIVSSVTTEGGIQLTLDTGDEQSC